MVGTEYELPSSSMGASIRQMLSSLSPICDTYQTRLIPHFRKQPTLFVPDDVQALFDGGRRGCVVWQRC
jgi:hypothetical protein